MMAGLRDFKGILFAAAKAAGFDAYEMYAVDGAAFSARVYQGELSEYKSAKSGGVAFRGVLGGKVGCAYTEDISDGAAGFLVKNAKENAEVMGGGEGGELYGGAGSYPEVNTYNEALDGVTAEAKIRAALDAEQAGLGFDTRVKAIDYNFVRTENSDVYIANSLGLDVSYSANMACCYCEAVAEAGGVKNEGFKLAAGRDFGALKPEAVARAAAGYAVSLLGAKPVKTGKYRVLFTNEAATELLQAFAPMFFADEAQKGLSFLSGRVGEVIGSELVTIVDDPLLDGGLNSAPFDGEGVAGFRKAVVEGGVFKTFLHNLKTAKKDGVKTTGNGFRHGYKSPVVVAASNMFIVPGERSFEELTRELGDGLIVSGVSGTHAGANAASGDFSLLSKGYLARGGEVVRPVDQITVAGNFVQMLKDALAVGDELAVDLPGRGGCVTAPALLVRELAVAGE